MKKNVFILFRRITLFFWRWLSGWDDQKERCDENRLNNLKWRMQQMPGENKESINQRFIKKKKKYKKIICENYGIMRLSNNFLICMFSLAFPIQIMKWELHKKIWKTRKGQRRILWRKNGRKKDCKKLLNRQSEYIDIYQHTKVANLCDTRSWFPVGLAAVEKFLSTLGISPLGYYSGAQH